MTMTRGQWFEVAFWLSFAAIAFALTWQFNVEIEIYEFGAYGWPRAVTLVIVLAVLGQLYHDYKFTPHGHPVAEAPEDAPEPSPPRDSAYVWRMAAVLGLPLGYALLLQPLGFYVLTPIFIIAFMYCAGERRWRWILGVTIGLYGFLLLAFARVLYLGLPTGNVRPFYDISNWLLVLIR